MKSTGALVLGTGFFDKRKSTVMSPEIINILCGG